MTTINITNNTGPINNYPSTYIPTKVCNTCRMIKPLTEFYKSKTGHDGYRSQCKNCCSNCRKEFYYKNKDDILKNHQEYYKQNKDEIADYNKEYYKENKVEILDYKKKHKDSINNQKNEYNKNKRNTNPIFRLISNNRARIRLALQSNRKATTTIELLQCDRQFFYDWIQFQLPYEMSDEEFRQNYHIDHVKAIANFDLSIKENQFEAFVWTNCCPLLKHKNLSKGAKRNIWLEVLQELKATVFLKLYYPEFCSNVEKS